MNKCVFCDKTSGLFGLEMEEDGIVYVLHICGQHYDTIAQIALAVVKHVLKKENKNGNN